MAQPALPSAPNHPVGPRAQLLLAATLGASAVALGAFGAHGLSEHLQAHDRVATWATAAHYHLVHAVALLAIAALTGSGHTARLATWLLTIGTVVFSGTLYLLCPTGHKWLGAITPIGGVLLIAGWLALAFVVGRRGQPPI